MELVLTLPVLVVLLLGILECSLLCVAQRSVAEASCRGARLATRSGAQAEDIQTEVRRALGPRLSTMAVVQVNADDLTGKFAAVSVEVPMTSVSPDLLRLSGISLAGRTLVSQSRITIE